MVNPRFVIKAVLSGQRLNINVPLTVAGTVNYIGVEAKCTSEWDDCTVVCYLYQAGTGYTAQLGLIYDAERKLYYYPNAERLTLTAGEWSVWFVGVMATSGQETYKVTSETRVFTVYEYPFASSIPPGDITLDEQAIARATDAQNKANLILDLYNAGKLTGPKGDPGDPAEIGFVQASVDSTTSNPSCVVTVTESPDNTYNMQFAFSGIKGAKGDTGATGPKGDTGAQGVPGRDGTDGRDGENGQTIDDYVLVQAEQPTSETNKMWLKPVAGESPIMVPTFDEYKAAIDSISTSNLVGRISNVNNSTATGITFTKQNGYTVVMHGSNTSTGIRGYVFLNGQFTTLSSNSKAYKPFIAGKYKITYAFTGQTIDLNSVYFIAVKTTMAADATKLNNGEITSIDAPFIIAMRTPKNTSFGTSDNPTTLTIKVELIEASKPNTIITTGDNTDRSEEIERVLGLFGECELGQGTFVVSGITMPNSTSLIGSGNASKLMLTEGISGTVVTLGSRCNVHNLTIEGANDDILLDGEVVGTYPVTEDTTSTNLWENGDVNIGDGGTTHIVLTNPLPRGYYKFSTLITKDDDTSSYIGFSNSQTGQIGSSNIISEITYNFSERKTYIFYLPETAYSVRLCSSTNTSTSSGIPSTWTDINITSFIQRNGIKWENANGFPCFISNCIIERFNGAGILLQDTLGPVDKGIYISNCWINNNNAGIFIRRRSEFNLISNCGITKNYYGYYNRGGNNKITNCGLDANIVGIVIDELEGGNAGHGLITGCTIHHTDNNTGNALIIRDTGRMIISGCGIGFGNIIMERTNGNIFNGCGFKDNTITITGGACNMFIGCIAATGTFHAYRTNNTASKIINCFNRDGTEIDFEETP